MLACALPLAPNPVALPFPSGGAWFMALPLTAVLTACHLLPPALAVHAREFNGDYALATLALVTVVCVVTVKPLPANTGFLPREQSEEWKGWMQMVLLTYHYFKVEALYKPARLIVASFVWLTAYGNTMFFLRARSCSPSRLASVLLRVHAAPIALCVAMDVPLMLYYVVPQTSMTLLLSFLTVRLAFALNARLKPRLGDTLALYYGAWIAVGVLSVLSMVVWDAGGWCLLWGWLPNLSTPLPQWALKATTVAVDGVTLEDVLTAVARMAVPSWST